MSLQPTRRIRVTFVFTHHIRWVPFELAAKLIDKGRFEIDYVILGPTDPMVDFLKANQIPVVTTTFDDYKKTPELVKFVYEHLKKNKTDIVQTHWFAGSLVGLQAAYYANVPVRIFHREHPPLRFYNRHPPSKHQLIWDCATHVIAVTPKSKAGMVEDGIPADKITVIPTGFDVEEFTTLDPGRVSALRHKYLASAPYASKGPIIGVIARYVRWKGVEDVIHAFKQVLEDYPNSLLILAGTHCERTEVIKNMKAASNDDIVAPQYDDILAIYDCLAELPPGSYLEIPFEDDLYSLFQLLDIFVHAPVDDIQETFGQVYVEAMLSKIPSVITLSGSALDHAIHRETAWIAEHQNSDQIAAGIVALLRDQVLRKKITENAFACAVENYSIAKQIRILEEFYLSALQTCNPSDSTQDPTIGSR